MNDVPFFDTAKAASAQQQALLGEFNKAKEDLFAYIDAVRVLYPGVSLAPVDGQDGSKGQFPGITWWIKSSDTPETSLSKLKLAVKEILPESEAAPSGELPVIAVVGITVTGGTFYAARLFADFYNLSERNMMDRFKRDFAAYCGVLYSPAGVVSAEKNLTDLTIAQREVLRFDTGKTYGIEKPII